MKCISIHSSDSFVIIQIIDRLLFFNRSFYTRNVANRFVIIFDSKAILPNLCNRNILKNNVFRILSRFIETRKFELKMYHSRLHTVNRLIAYNCDLRFRVLSRVTVIIESYFYGVFSIPPELPF